MLLTHPCQRCGSDLEFTHEQFGTWQTCPTCKTEAALPEKHQYRRTSTGPVKPHRGTMIMVFGIVGLFVFPFAFAAWQIGAGDLKAMKEGTMDTNGKDLTNTGYCLGFIVSVIYLLIICGFLALIFLTATLSN